MSAVSPEDSCSPFIRCAKGTAGQDEVLQIEDLKRHAQSDKHLDAISRLSRSAEEPEGDERSSSVSGPTLAQVRLSLEVLRTVGSGQGPAYEQRSELARRADPSNYPLSRSSRHEHGRIIRAMCEVLREEERLHLLPNCQAIGWAEETACRAGILQEE